MTFKIKDGIIVAGSEFVDGSKNVSAANVTLTGELRGPASMILDPITVGDDTGAVTIKGSLTVNSGVNLKNGTELQISGSDGNLVAKAKGAGYSVSLGDTANGANLNVLRSSSNVYVKGLSGSLYLQNDTANGVVLTTNGGTIQFTVSHTSSAVNYLQATGAITTTPVVLSAQGTDSDVTLSLLPKGAGKLNLNGEVYGTSIGVGPGQIKPMWASIKS